MPQEFSYINLINDFWSSPSPKWIGTPATALYLHLLHRINRNRWKPVFISDAEIAESINISRRGMPGYKAALVAEGLIVMKSHGTGRAAGTQYFLPEETVQKVTVSTPQTAQKGTVRKKETAQKGTVNCAKRNSLAASTPYNRYNKTYKTSSSTISACAHNDGGGNVEIEAVKVEEVEATKTETEKYRQKRAKAASQGTEVMATFFDSNNHAAIERLCMNNHITPDHLRDTARQIVDDWTQEGTCHDDPGGNFNLSDAIRHLRLTIPHRLAAQQRQNNRAAPASRQENRQRLMEAARDNLNRAIANQHRPPAEPAPPF